MTGNRPKLTLQQILAWADAHHARTGRWPQSNSGPVRDDLADNWRSVDNLLRLGLRGLSGGSSLARFLDEKRGVRNKQNLPRLTVEGVLRWADAHHVRWGRWPTCEAGPVLGVPLENWQGVDAALREGLRGLPGDLSLAQLLEEHRGVPNRMNRPRLTVKQILTWADSWHQHTGRWPQKHSGPIPDAPGETWLAVDDALAQGHRGLPGGSSLAQLLARRRGVRHPVNPPRLTVGKILAWAKAHHRRTGRWPTAASGPVAEAAETWNAINQALGNGVRGLEGKTSLARLLQDRLGVPMRKGRRPPRVKKG